MDLQSLFEFFEQVEKDSKAGKGKLALTENEYKIAQQLLKEVKRRLEYLIAGFFGLFNSRSQCYDFGRW